MNDQETMMSSQEKESSRIQDPETVEANETTVETAAPSEGKNYHAMDREGLLAAMRDIVDNNKADAHKDVPAIKQAYFLLRQRETGVELDAFIEAGNAPEDFKPTPDAGEDELKELIERFREIRAKFLEDEKARLEANLAKKREILKEMNAIVEDADNINLNYNKFNELRQEFKDIKDVPATDETDIWKQFQSVTEHFYDTLKISKELRDLDFKRNLEAKLKLIERTVALEAEKDIVEASRILQSIQAEWREIGPVVKEQRDKIWEDFREASAKIYRSVQEFYENRKAEEKKNAEAKEALCVEGEAIDFSTFDTYSQWDEATARIKELQAKWKETGFTGRKLNAELFARFRKVCDAFFEAKAAYTRELKETLQKNLEKKIALCERAEALGNSEDLRANLNEVVKLQAEWKKIGSVPRKVSDTVWERFTTACNKFFKEKREELDKRKEEQTANLEAKRTIIAKLKEIPEDLDRNEAMRQVKELQAQWNEIGHVPFHHKDKVYAQYREVCDALYGKFNESRRNERRKSYAAHINNVKGDDRKMNDERTRLQRAIEQKRAELQTYDNNLGFFNVKSAAGNSLLKEIERKKARIEEDIKQIEEKIALLDSAGE